MAANTEVCCVWGVYFIFLPSSLSSHPISWKVPFIFERVEIWEFEYLVVTIQMNSENNFLKIIFLFFIL